MKTKQVIVIRKDLKMRRGKEIAQGAHASMAFLTRRLKGQNTQYVAMDRLLQPVEKEWIDSSFRKITCYVDSEEQLQDLHIAALAAGVTSQLITDSGTTEFGGIPTVTCLALGPDYEERLDPLTGGLKLY